MLTSSAIKAQARTLGFDVCGIAPATALPELARLHDWLARGHARRDVVPGPHRRGPHRHPAVPARRPVGHRHRDQLLHRRAAGARRRRAGAGRPLRARRGLSPRAGRAARRAAGLDAARDGRARSTAAPFVDKHWVQERVFAAYAGLGWIGKHSLLINRDLGSWLLLAGIATTLPLEPDGLVDDQCGACTLCLDACPTGAIVAPRDVDARALPQLPDHRARRAGAGAGPRRSSAITSTAATSARTCARGTWRRR